MKLLPATVASWDGKVLRVHIEGHTDGADIPPQAEICYAFSDRPERTGFRILKGDAVWVILNENDSNQPIVMGFRNKNTGSSKETRRLEHTNIEFNANENLNENSKNHTVKAEQTAHILAQSIQIDGDTITLTGNVQINGDVSIQGGLGASGNAVVSGNIHADGTISDSDGRDTA